MGKKASNIGMSIQPWEYSYFTCTCLVEVSKIKAWFIERLMKVFPGYNQYERFMHIFEKTIKYHIEYFWVLGIKEGSLGSHSCRKTRDNINYSGCKVLPPMASIYLWSFRSMVPAKYRYTHDEKVGDQFMGSTITGISALTNEFAISPYYFDYTWAPIVTKLK